jgi:outer membrane protein TolC
MFLGLLTGCVRYESQPLQPVALERDFRARSLTDARLRTFVVQNFTNPPMTWPPAEFDLKSLTLAALYFHPDLNAVRAHIATAEAAEITAGARPNPTATLLPTWVGNTFPGETPWMFGASFDVPIETAGKRRKRIEQARLAAFSARATYGEAAWTVRSRLRAALVEYFCAQRSLELFKSEAHVELELTNLLSQRLQAGETSQFELTVAETEALNATIALRAAESRVADGRLAVAAALGVPGSALSGISPAWKGFDAPPEDVSIDSMQKAGLVNRLDVQRSLADYAVADAGLRLEIAKQYPDVHLEPGYEFDQGEHKFSIGPSIAIPLFDRNQGPIAEAKARRDEAAAAFLSVQADAIEAVEKATTDYHYALAEWSEADRATDALQGRIEKATEAQVQLGATDRLTLFYTQLQRYAAMQARLASLRKVQDAIGALEDAIQHPLFDSVDWQSVTRKGTP